MAKQVGTFVVEDAFRITGRGWVLTGVVSGSALAGNELAFPNGVFLRITGVELINMHRLDKAGLLISDQFASRQEVLDQQIIGATALILE